MWNHPFIPKEIINEENNNRILQQPKLMMNSVINKISSSVNQKEENENKIDYKIENDICDICGELKDFHKIKDYDFNNLNNQNNNNNIFNNQNNANNFDLINLNQDDNNENNNIIINNNNRNILIDDDEKEEEKEEDIDPNKCPICMDDFENPVEIEKCKHKFCFECFDSYLVNLINTNNIDKIPCPKNKCLNKELTEEFFSQYLSEQEYFKYRQFKSKNEIARDAKKFFCPYCDSYAQIEGNIEDYDSNNPNYKKSILKCKNGHEFCSCGRPIHENECYHDEKEFKDLISNEQIKKCPKCGFLIKKIRGCNHMTCGNPICKYEFCWLCMNEAVPGHYEYGECAGKQFYDPDSFSSYLERNYPILSSIYNAITIIIAIVLFPLFFIVFPAIGFSFIFYGLIYEEGMLIQTRNRASKFLFFLTCIYMSLCYQSFIYLSWIFIINFILLIFVASCLVTLICSFICSIYRYCRDCFTDERNLSHVGDNEIELSNSFNDLGNHYENNDGNNSLIENN